MFANVKKVRILISMLQAAQNYILVEIEKKFQDERGSIIIDTTWEPAEHATLEGTVISVPAKTKSDNRKITGTVKEGDKIFFSYCVIHDYVSQPEDDTPVYRNLVVFEGKEYWKVDIREAFCKITQEGIEMITDNVLIEPLSEDTGVVKAISKNLSCNVRDIVCFQPQFVQRYNIFGSEHYIIPARRLLAKVN